MNEPDERRAEELEAVLLLAEAGQQDPLLPTMVDPEEMKLAVQLVQLASSIALDRDFGAGIEATLLTVDHTNTDTNTTVATRTPRTRRQRVGGGSRHNSPIYHLPQGSSPTSAVTPPRARHVS